MSQKRSDGFYYLEDYKEPGFFTPEADLNFILDKDSTEVTTKYKVNRNPNLREESLFFHGLNLEFQEGQINGKILTAADFVLSEKGIEITNLPDQNSFEIVLKNKISPLKNTALEGLYVSDKMLCTQNEPEGFRRITYAVDRPDNMIKFKVRLEGSKKDYPFLLSNGNLIESGELDGDRHWCQWEDPFPKPSYLFAIVAGNFDKVSDAYTTGSGRKVDIHFYSDPGDGPKCEYALESLKRAMKWDEDRFGLEYDLDLYMVVAASSFNMGAMENKGLNVFNSALVLADPNTATDDDYHRIESVIGHEYFHNWTGNRVTLKNWFQLTLKEGLTVFRDQEFSADLNDRDIERLDMVDMLRMRQFPEDAGPLSHPIRPEKYSEMNNFYTATVYEKGAEVIRMIHSLLGEENFQSAMKTYFKNYDGKSITTEDFLSVMFETMPDVSLNQFVKWYSESGTPSVNVTEHYDSQNRILKLKITQKNLKSSEPMLIPMKLNIYHESGSEADLDSNEMSDPEKKRKLLFVDKSSKSYEFKNIGSDFQCSYFQGFSAPVNYKVTSENRNLATLVSWEKDGFNKANSVREILIDAVHSERAEGAASVVSKVLGDVDSSSLLKSVFIKAPSFEELFQSVPQVDPHGIFEKRMAFQRSLGNACGDVFLSRANESASKKYSLTLEDRGDRALKTVMLGYLSASTDFKEKADNFISESYLQADNMTDKFGYLYLSQFHQLDCAETVSKEFFEEYKSNDLTLQKWIMSQVSVPDRALALDRVSKIEASDFYNTKVPNFVRSLWGGFIRNNLAFHSEEGYAAVLSAIARIDAFNPQMSSALMKLFQVGSSLIPAQKTILVEKMKEFAQGSKFSDNLKETYGSVAGGLGI